jgi:RNA polymerase sigma-70 factor (ECF subfamily)
LRSPFLGLDENSLVAAAKRGQKTAFDELCQSHAQRILRVTYRITRNREDAEDAMQDSLMMAFIHIKDFDGRSSFSTWLTRIAFNSALMILRKKRAGLELSMDDPRTLEGNGDIPADAPDPEAYFAQREREEIIRSAVRSLRPTIRQAVELQQLQENSVSDTARLMGLTLTATKARLFHARIQLRKSLKPESTNRNRASGKFRLPPAA